MKRKVALAVLITLTVMVAGYGAWLIKHHMDYAITNAVFVDTEDIVNVGFKRVAGRIVKMTKREGDPVRRGEVLAVIDDRDYRLQVRAIEKQLEALRAKRRQLNITLSRIKRQLHLSVSKAKDRVKALNSQIRSVKAEIEALRAQTAQTRRDRNRFYRLYRRHAVARRRFEELDTRLKVLKEKTRALKERLKALKVEREAARKDLKMAISNLSRIKETQEAIRELNRQIESLQAKLEDAKLQVGYCVLKSPITGRVAKKYRSTGDVVGPGMPVYALVDPKDIFILVLLEETKLKGVKPGCPARIKIDALPDEEYRGVVERILPTSAAKFALVPRDISAGEFTKVVQRIPVKVRITGGDISKLVVGMGGEIEIKRAK